jgi:hypothetical protein
MGSVIGYRNIISRYRSSVAKLESVHLLLKTVDPQHNAHNRLMRFVPMVASRQSRAYELRDVCALYT